ncbi:MAG: polysaccharide deacetylase family protein [Roseburia sp.]|nr:polysaccharide deacetylase family protein [Roseburia sp.]
MAKVVFRFDIDSHKCIRDGVPVLLELSKRYDVPFTFYVNVGRAISRVDTICSFFEKRLSTDAEVKMLSAKQKLGTKDYLYAAIVNPVLGRYKENILAISQSKCELGLHGGMNHSHWHMHALQWPYGKIRSDLERALKKMRRIVPEYRPEGFASPGFVTNDVIERVLRDMGFRYSSNRHENNATVVHKAMGDFSDIGVNLCGEPGGIAFWEYATASGWTDCETIDTFINMVSTHDEVVVFDHPYFVAVQKAKVLEKIINIVIRQGHEIVTMKELALEDAKTKSIV